MYYTIPEIMKLLKVSERTIHKWTASGQLPVVKIGKVIRIDEKDLTAFVEAHKQNK